MTEFGKTLREAREAKGLTASQISEQTHLLPQIVEELENEDFHRISAPIYGRGFVKLYCEAVGLDPKPLVEEFMAILNGERQPAIKIREIELPPEEKATVEGESGREGKVEVEDEGVGEGEGEGEETTVDEPPPQPVYTQPDLVAEPPTVITKPETRDPRVTTQIGRPERDPRVTTQIGRHETVLPPPLRQYNPSYARSFAALGRVPNFGRLAILAGGAIALIVLLVWGVRALYRASMGETGETKKATVVVEVEDSAPEKDQAEGARQEARDASGDKKAADKKAKNETTGDEATAVKRQPREVPALYID